MKLIGFDRLITDDFDLNLNEYFEERSAILSVINFDTTLIVHYTVEGGGHANRCMMAIDKKTMAKKWHIDPCQGWPVKNIHQFISLDVWAGEANYYGGVDVLVKNNIEGRNLLREIFYYDYQGKGDDVDWDAYEKHEYYVEPRDKYVLKTNYYKERLSDNELVQCGRMNVFPDEGEREDYGEDIIYADVSQYPEEDILLMCDAQQNIFHYELDVNTGKTTPAYAYVKVNK